MLLLEVEEMAAVMVVEMVAGEEVGFGGGVARCWQSLAARSPHTAK
jgi:hypothetical protein